MNVDFQKEPWNNASLVMPRHAVRMDWNEAATHQFCHETHQPIFVCVADDMVAGRPLTACESDMLESRHDVSGRGRGERSKGLVKEIRLAIGMKVMVTDNIETNLDLTNEAQGEIVDIILHADEPLISNLRVVFLQHLPSYILVKLT